MSDASPPRSSPSSPSSTPRWRPDGAVLDTMFASALSGMLARIPLHPIDTCKAKMQVQQQFVSSSSSASSSGTALPRSLYGILRSTLTTSGYRGLYSGFGITFLGSGPAACLYFTTYEYSKSLLTSPSFTATTGLPVFAAHFASGLIAECVSCVMWVPVDVVKERLQVQQQLKEMMSRTPSSASPLPSTSLPLSSSSSRSAPSAALYRGNLDAIMTISRTEGLRGVYRGYGATVASFGPFSAIYLSGYEQFKTIYEKLLVTPSTTTINALTTNDIKQNALSSSSSSSSSSSAAAPVSLPFLVYALSGASAGGVASVLTNPLDLVKLRLQVQRGNSGFTFGYTSMWHGLKCIVAQEGVKALFKGAAARCMFHIPSTALTIAMFDTLRDYLREIRTK